MGCLVVENPPPHVGGYDSTDCKEWIPGSLTASFSADEEKGLRAGRRGY
jgi:hypothetical protein